MARPRPFLFVRYSVFLDGEKLDGSSQFTFFSEMQGQLAAHGKKAQEDGRFDTLVMRPRKHQRRDTTFLTWSVGQVIETRVQATYDGRRDRLMLATIDDGGVRYSDFVAIPKLDVLAVDDRASSELHLGGKQALNRLRSIMRADGAQLEVTREVSPDEVSKALETWDLQKYSFTVRPNNPRPVGKLAKRLSEQMKADGIGQYAGVAKPVDGQSMQKSNEGLIEATSELVEAGYGQQAMSGNTPNGIRAEIKKPRFDQDPERNDKAREKDRELRVFIESEDEDEEEIMKTTFDTLKEIYGND